MDGATSYDVVIVGCGPVGAFAANVLGRDGWRVLVVERELDVYPLPRAAHFDHEVMRAFQGIGLAEVLLPATWPVRGMHFTDADRQTLVGWDTDPEPLPTGWHNSYMFHQPDLERVLRRGIERYPEVVVRLGAEVTDVRTSDSGAVVTIQAVGDRSSSGTTGESATGEPTTVEARWVLACDGARSGVRRLVGIDVEDLGFDEPWLVVDVLVDADVDLPQRVLQVCDPARPTTFVPMPGNRRRWEFMLLPGEEPDAMQAPEVVRGLLSAWVAPEQLTIERSAVYRFHALIAQQYRAGRVLLAGDAAHQMPPFFGQGMCAGIRDVENLAWKLAAVLGGSAPESLLDTYPSERRPHVRAIIQLAVAFGGMLCTLDPDVAARRDDQLRASDAAGVASAGALPPIGPGLGDRTGPFGGLVGTVAPQPFVGAADEARVRLDDLVGAHPVLVVRPNGADSALPTAWTALGGATLVATGPLDTDGGLAGWLDGIGADAVLVRPDHIVFGAAAGGEAASALATAFVDAVTAPARS